MTNVSRLVTINVLELLLCLTMFSGAIHEEHTERMVQTLPRKSLIQ
jgi:hypothetical protein